MWQDALFHANHNDDGKLQPLDLVQRDERQVLLLAIFQLILLRDEGHLLEEAAKHILGGALPVGSSVLEFAQVVETVVGIGFARLEQHSPVAGPFNG